MAPAATKSRCEQELAALEELIAGKEGELEGVSRHLAAAQQRQAALRGELQQKERRLQAMYDKQGRSAQVGGLCGAKHSVFALVGDSPSPGTQLSTTCAMPASSSPPPPNLRPALPCPQFNSTEERDEWVRKEVEQLEATVAQKRENQRGAQQQLAAAQAEVEEVGRAGWRVGTRVDEAGRGRTQGHSNLRWGPGQSSQAPPWLR